MIKKTGAGSGGTKIDPYLKLQLGKGKRAPRKRTKTQKNSGKNPDFKNEHVTFDIHDPQALLLDDDIVLKLSVWDDNMISDDLLGEVDVSILRFFGGAYVKEWFPLKFVGKPIAGVDSPGEIFVQFHFEPALVGMLCVTVFEGRNLKNMELVGKQDPYVKIALGPNYSKRTKTAPKGGRNPYFREEELLFWVSKDNWHNELAIQCFDEDVGSDDLIGAVSFPILPYMTPEEDPKQELVPLKNKAEDTGELMLKIEFMPAGVLKVTCIEARHLLDPDGKGRQDPFLQFTMEGQCSKMTKRTRTDIDGGTSPKFGEEILFDVVDHHSVLLECFHEDKAAQDDLIGSTEVSLLPIFKKGYLDDWVPIHTKSKWGGHEAAGEVHLTLEFSAPEGIAYPQHRPQMDSFDESKRVNNSKAKAEQAAAEAAERKRAAAAREQLLQTAGPRSTEFSDEEILNAFRFIDLDKNMFVGAAEIRHVLVCMGELITDEEVDEMISMLDGDGDGQVSYEEFYMLITDPDPGRPGWTCKASTAGFDAAEEDVTEGMHGHATHMDATAAHHDPSKGPMTTKQKTAALRLKQQKKILLTKFAMDNHVRIDTMQRIWSKFTRMNGLDNGSKVDFETWCSVLEVEGTGEYRELFKNFDYIGDGTINLKEFILGLMNFINAEPAQRVDFSFKVYDEDHNGFLTEEHLIQMLKANHMTAEQNVLKKAKTIMKHSGKDSKGHISLEEFHVVSEKFPNILFPPSS